ncbi:MAG: hypothetical protein ACLRM8_04875 [Alistipes sp.]
MLYGGLMKTPQGIKVIEFNARFGDPDRGRAAAPEERYRRYLLRRGRRADTQLEWHDFATLGVVLASKGYPGL